MVNRRKFLKSAGAIGTVGLTGTAGCIGTLGGSGGGSGTEEVNFLLSPAESDVDVQKQYKPLFDYLEEEADVTIKSNVAKDYAAVLQALKSGQADIADAAPAVAIAGKKEDATDIMGIRVAYGAAKYFSFLTTKNSYDVSEVSDLKGETIAFADPLSTSGSLFPLYMLSKAGLDVGDAPQGDAKDFTGQWSDHSTARETLINRDPVKAAGTGAFSTIAHVPKDQLPKRVKDINPSVDDAGSKDPQLDLLQASDPIPRAPILARRDWESDKRDSVRKALLDAEESDLVDEDAEEKLWFTGVTKGDISDYDPVQSVLDELGLEFGDL